MKFAYLIMAHKWDDTLKTQLELLDDPRNDIFIHVDSKCKDFPFQFATEILRKGRCYFTKRINVTWGGVSQISAELILLKTACKNGKYDYYHLLSGQDLPLKSQDIIHTFFTENRGKEFLRFYSSHFEHGDRVHYYWVLQDFCGRENTVLARSLRFLQRIFVSMQRFLHIKRGKNIRFQKGSNWFSITDDFARYVLSHEKWIRKTFRFTFCGDEVFMQTLLYNSPYIEKLYRRDFDNDMHAIMRLIIWEGYGPHIFTMEDKELIKHTDLLFGRKFDIGVDPNIIEFIKGTII